MSKAVHHKKPKNERLPPSKIRDCLKCQQSFTSTWSGERVCAKCKASSVWRESGGGNMEAWYY